MAIFNLAGHNNSDPGAISGIYKEADFTKEFRNLVNTFINKEKYKVINDSDSDTLAQMLRKLKPGNGSVCVEWHLDAALNPNASGTSAFVKLGASKESIAFAKELTDTIATVLEIPNRGVSDPTKSHRGSLAMPQMAGITCLCEICFLTNSTDREKLSKRIGILAANVAKVLIKYDDLIQ